jgi:hypothetical protein
MTLILALGNRDQFIQVSDRRLSSNGKPIDDESNKAGVLICPNARMAFGFTGLAAYETFKTQDFILDALTQSGPPDYQIALILQRFLDKISNEFLSNPVLKRIPARDKRLSIMFSGYLYNSNPPRQAYAIITNYQGLNDALTAIDARDCFEHRAWWQKNPLEETTAIQRIGMWQAMNQDDEKCLRALLVKREPARVLVEKACELILRMADRESAQNTIGKQISSIILPMALNAPPLVDYHTSHATNIVHLPDCVQLFPESAVAIKQIQFGLVESQSTPMLVPKVGRNEQCPCGSGKKFKKCHGRNNRSKN